MRYKAYVIVILVEEPQKERKSMKKRCKRRTAAKKAAVRKPRNASKGKKKEALKRKRKVMSEKPESEMTAKGGAFAFVFKPVVTMLVEDPVVVVGHAPKPEKVEEKAEGGGEDSF